MTSSAPSSSSSLFPIRSSDHGTSAVAWSTWWELPPSLLEIMRPDQEAGYNFPSSSSSSGAVRLLRRSQVEYGWDLDLAKRILMAYKDFLYAVSFLPTTSNSNHNIWLIPCPLVRDIWQLHICDTQHYANDCQVLLGRMVHYNNYLESDTDRSMMMRKKNDNNRLDVLDEESSSASQESLMLRQRRKHKRQMIRKTIKFICEKTNQEQLDPKVWQYYNNTTTTTTTGTASNSVMSRPTYSLDPARTNKPLSLKRDSSSSSNEDHDDESGSTTATSRKKMRRLNTNDTASSVTNHLQTTTTTTTLLPTKVTIQIQFTSNNATTKNGLSNKQKKDTTSTTILMNDENAVNHTTTNKENYQRHLSSSSTFSSCRSFTTYKHAPLFRIFDQVAQEVYDELDRHCLQFTFQGQVLEGNETPHALSKKYYDGMSGGGGDAVKKKNKTDNNKMIMTTIGGSNNNGILTSPAVAEGKPSPLRQSLKPAAGGGAGGVEEVLKIECSRILSEC